MNQSGISEPEREAAAELGPTQPEHPVLVRDPVGLNILGPVLDIDHLLKRHHGDTELAFVLGHQRLRVAGAI